MTVSLHEVCCARLARTHLAALASARCADDVTALPDGNDLWLHWRAGDEAMLRLVLPLPGVALFAQRAGRWYPLGSRLPVQGPPAGTGQRLDQFIVPAPARPVPADVPTLRPLPLRLVRDRSARPTSGMWTTLAVLAPWAEDATSAQLSGLRAALAGERVFLLGQQLPLLPDSARLWGRRLLAPLGYRPEPAWPEKTLLEALGIATDDLALLDETGVEVLPAEALQPLTRAAVRLAWRERGP
ncbi:MAG: hypothetical protein JNM56_01220 [Planctomycetia bacterium]|nr:hypothetical protein [Planctomycetia bacterium]